jgi:hypothetical protein
VELLNSSPTHQPHHQVLETPLKILETPLKILETPLKILETPTLHLSISQITILIPQILLTTPQTLLLQRESYNHVKIVQVHVLTVLHYLNVLYVTMDSH